MRYSPEHERVFTEWVSKAREADILEEALARGAMLRRTGGEHLGPCPLCGGTDRFSINPVKQIFNCRGTVGGDVIKLVEHIDGLNFMQAVEQLAGEPLPGRRAHQIGDAEREECKRRRERADAQRVARQESQATAEAANRKHAGEIWRASVSIAGTLAEVYLNSRGIPKPDEGWPDCLRFHPALKYPDRGRMPALVCRVDSPRDTPMAIWRIYLRADGQGKADVPNAKLGLAPVSSGAVRLGGVGEHIGLAEGVESALGAWMLTGCKFPVWATLSTSGMAGINMPGQVKRATIFLDGDKPTRRKGHDHIPSEPAGRKAAMSLRLKLQEQGILCDIAAEPPAGKDYLDLWVATQRIAA